MSSYIIRGLELYTSEKYFPLFNNISYFSNIDFINSVINYFFFKHFNPILSMNLLAIMYFGLTFLVTYMLFRKLSLNYVGIIIFSTLFSSSIYFLYRVLSFTPNLYQIFFFPLVIYLLHIKKINIIFLSVILFVLFSYSSYYGFFSLLLIIFWYFSELWISNEPFLLRIKQVFIKLIMLITPLLILLITIYSSSVLKNLSIFTKSIKNQEQVLTGSRYRTIEDFYNFSSRPWYFIIPPQNSVYFGDLSKTIYKKLVDTHYYLADDYSEREMAGSYMGWHFIIGTLVVFILLWLKKFKKVQYSSFNEIYKNKKLITRCFIIIVGIVLISGPPSFTISGHLFYTPSYLLYFIAPAFRSLVRLSSVIYLLVLMVNFFLFLDLYNMFTKKLYIFLFVFIFIAINYFLFAIQIPVIDINKVPSEIEYMKSLKPNSTYVVYPNGDYYSIFWILQHKQKLINPVDFENSKIDFNSNKFSEKLLFKDGIDTLRLMNIDYVVLYKNRILPVNLKKIENIFMSMLDKNIFENTYSIIYKVE